MLLWAVLITFAFGMLYLLEKSAAAGAVEVEHIKIGCWGMGVGPWADVDVGAF